LRLIARRARGGLRDAESMLDQILSLPEDPITANGVAKYLRAPPAEIFFQLDEHCSQGDAAFAFHLTETLSDIDPLLFLEGLAEHYRLLLSIRFDPKLLEKTEYEWLEAPIKQAYLHSANSYTTDQCLFILEETVNWLQKIGKSPYPRFAVEILLLTILRSKKRIAIDSLLQKLSQLEKQIQAQKQTPAPPPPAPPPAPQESLVVKETAAATASLPNPNTRHETLMRFAAVELEGSIKKIT
jgi:DNA polymerase-3 subunit gamma/tau